ncbi:hypothetical protein ACR55_03798 [Bordetella hinzii]|uniref:Methyltransferase type 11 domain-containing protein n=2 Tax=Bordetella hinzii TaxID=103855 RepID=A0AAN1RWF2_9BORD|nr:hypothetical protein ACR55_03798 [Bordetella hinzii]AZW17406.1 hypothetical protein CS347_11845 [Bordetella hinzii]QET44007.1 methyltransferase domain-containing protein [Bordetella hinzii]
MTRRLMITIDVEAQPKRASSEHIDRLIYGRFDGGEYGIGCMMDCAERYGLPLTCYLDYAEKYLYGDKLLNVGRYISGRGHDLQIHLHPEFFPPDFFKSREIRAVTDMFHSPLENAKAFIDAALVIHGEITDKAPLAFRGGGYRFGKYILLELARNGVIFNSGYNPGRVNQPFNIGPVKQFRWEAGVIELPISNVWNFKNTARLFYYNFNASTLLSGSVEDCVQKHAAYLEDFYSTYGEDAIAVMVLHSWSFLKLDGDGCYSTPSQDAVDKFNAVLAYIKDNCTVITSADLAKSGLEDIKMVYEYKHQSGKGEDAQAKLSKFKATTDKYQCEVCGSDFENAPDSKAPARKCGVCGSLERQRAFVTLAKNHRLPIDLGKAKKILIVSPSVCELKYFSSLSGPDIFTLDIRPEVKPDFIADLCNMPHVDSEAYDIVYACHVLSHVHDLQSAIAEIHRILAPDGVFINHEPLMEGAETKEVDDVEKITAHYGVEAFQKYKIGRFRLFGDKNIDKVFYPYFSSDRMDAIDMPTETKVTWFAHRKNNVTLTGNRRSETMSSNYVSPYRNREPRQFWKSGVAEQTPTELDGLYRKRYVISETDVIATAGSCFAQHIARHLKSRGCNVLDVEPAPRGLDESQAQKYGYGLYSARYGNIYHVRQLLQLAQEAYGLRSPVDISWERGGRWFDALRPSVEPLGLESAAAVERHRRHHLERVRSMFQTAGILVFTFGLTEAWRHRASGTVYPTAPGTLAGSYDPALHEFVNFGFPDIYKDFMEFRELIKQRNSKIKFLLTVSPVPLTATAEDQHVLVSTVYSKSVLRAAVGQIYAECDDVDYFPSYEIISSPFSRGMFFHPNLRSVTNAGVENAMRIFFSEHGNLGAQESGAERGRNSGGRPGSPDDVVCEEILLEAFGS